MVLSLLVGFVIVKHYSESDWFVQNTRSYQGSSMLRSQTKNQVSVLSGSGPEIFTKCLQFGVLAVWCGLIICPVARSCDVKSVWLPKIAVFSAENGADRYRSVVSSSFRQGPVKFAHQRRVLRPTIYVLKLCNRSVAETVFTLPRGVIGNTQVFGTWIPGSSPGGVALLNE